jgi:hypothetical protein
MNKKTQEDYKSQVDLEEMESKPAAPYLEQPYFCVWS